MSCAAAGSDQGVWGAADAAVGPSVPLPWPHPSHCRSHEIHLQENNRKQRGSGVQLGAGVMELEGLELGVCAEPLGRGSREPGRAVGAAPQLGGWLETLWCQGPSWRRERHTMWSSNLGKLT